MSKFIQTICILMGSWIIIKFEAHVAPYCTSCITWIYFLKIPHFVYFSPTCRHIEILKDISTELHELMIQRLPITSTLYKYFVGPLLQYAASQRPDYKSKEKKILSKDHYYH